MTQIIEDLLPEIFENLDNASLRSCLCVCRIWCEISVKFLWKKILNYETLISCLPHESKSIVSNVGILIPTSNTPLCNYASFCKILLVDNLYESIKKLLNKQDSDENICTVSNEIQGETDVYYKISNSIIKLDIVRYGINGLCSIINNFINLRILILSIDNKNIYTGFENLYFPKIRSAEIWG
jgi:hypothetical protein